MQRKQKLSQKPHGRNLTGKSSYATNFFSVEVARKKGIDDSGFCGIS